MRLKTTGLIIHGMDHVKQRISSLLSFYGVHCPALALRDRVYLGSGASIGLMARTSKPVIRRLGRRCVNSLDVDFWVAVFAAFVSLFHPILLPHYPQCVRVNEFLLPHGLYCRERVLIYALARSVASVDRPPDICGLLRILLLIYGVYFLARHQKKTGWAVARCRLFTNLA
jgi:hypothetical protein